MTDSDVGGGEVEKSTFLFSMSHNILKVSSGVISLSFSMLNKNFFKSKHLKCIVPNLKDLTTQMNEQNGTNYMIRESKDTISPQGGFS